MSLSKFNPELLKKLYIPSSNSHKGQNGKLLLIGGSHLFHAASLWSLNAASRIVDMVFYSSVPENNEIILWAKEEFRNGIVVPRNRIEDYVKEADCILLGPGMTRTQKENLNKDLVFENIEKINSLEDEGELAYYLTKFLIAKYPHKKWVIDAGALQMMDPEWLLKLNGNVIITPHPKEFVTLFKSKLEIEKLIEKDNEFVEIDDETMSKMAKKYKCTILLKGKEDRICSANECVMVAGGNAGMTKGGTGDVLSGLVAALACKNEIFLSACAGSFINKKAGEELFSKVGYYFNASDLTNEIPIVMKKYILS